MTDHEQLDGELARRLRTSVSHRIPDETRQQHLAAIGRALSDTSPTSTVASSGRFTQLRRGLTAVAASLSLLVPTGVAVASQRAMPGQPLYDVKQATEVVWQVVDGTVRTRNRLDELERLLDAGAPREELQVAVQRALDAVQALPADHPLQLRLLRLLNRYDRLVAAMSDDHGDDRDDDVRAPTSGRSGDDSDGDREDRSGSGSGDDDSDDDDSGSGSDDPTEIESDDDSSSSGSGADDDPSESETDDNSGPGSDGEPTETETDDDSGSGSDDDPTDSEADEDSSGPGSGDDPTDLEAEDDSSGTGSGSD